MPMIERLVGVRQEEAQETGGYRVVIYYIGGKELCWLPYPHPSVYPSRWSRVLRVNHQEQFSSAITPRSFPCPQTRKLPFRKLSFHTVFT